LVQLELQKVELSISVRQSVREVRTISLDQMHSLFAALHLPSEVASASLNSTHLQLESAVTPTLQCTQLIKSSLTC
jgi:hypothetical protein